MGSVDSVAVFLKSLTLKGFKSFAETTTLVFEPGITVVVGPNGSGKSNVVDAVAWVLGAQGPRTVRSTRMEDVIFAGTANRAALGRAEVSLTIDNSAGLLPIDFAEVTITRTLFRASGESEYAINDVPCRLLDIQELLSDSGVGRTQHVIVSQGQLDAVLNARPEDRRAIVEEAAGVLKFRRRREKAQRRLESTEGNLVRLNDLLREVRRQLKPLERQADAARRHDAVADELRALRVHLAGREISGLTKRLEGADRARSDRHVDEAAIRGELTTLDDQVAVAEHELDAGRSDELADLLLRVETAAQRASALTSVVNERRRSAVTELAAAIDETVVASLEADSARLAEELIAVDDEARTLVPRVAELEAAEADLAAMPEPDAASVSPVESARAFAEAQGERAALAAALAAAEASRDETRRRADALTAEHQQLENERAGHEDAVTAGSEAAGLAAARAAAATHAADECRARRDAAAAEHRAAHAGRARAEGRRDALAAALDHARARAGAERLEGIDGLLGTLLDLVEVDAGWEAAFEAAAGEAITAVVVDGEPAARAALERLAAAAHDSADATPAGGAVLALDAVAPPAPSPLTTAPGGRVRDHVRSRHEAVERLLDVLLATAVAVDGGWPAALDLVLASPGAVAVTRHGDRFSASGWRVGTGGVGATGAALEAAQAATDAAAASEVVTAAALATADDELAVVAGELAQATSARYQAERALAEAERVLSAISTHAAARGAEATAAVETKLRLEQRCTDDRARLDTLDAELVDLETAARETLSAADALALARQRRRDRTEAVAALRNDFEIRAASIDERRNGLTARRAEVEARLARLAGDRTHVAAKREALQARVATAERIAGVLREHSAWLGEARQKLRTERERYTAGRRETIERLDRLRRARTDAERRLSENRELAQRAELEAAEARLRLETVTEALRRELDVEPETAVATPPPDVAPGTTPAARSRDLERELRLMGPINPLALEEHAALQERHDFLSGQLEDVKNSRRELAKVIRAVDTEIVDLFAAAYADVADNFEKLFGTLFPGGMGRLRLTDPDHPLDTGIEVEARPSGKNVRKLSLLSGGERSLTALAFLFAVFRSRPSPFYLMDEVEAALDDVNLHRFLDLIHEFREDAQLVIVSHQKRTMEAADCLYGVTMQPGGSSKVVSERLVAPAPASPVVSAS